MEGLLSAAGCLGMDRTAHGKEKEQRWDSSSHRRQQNGLGQWPSGQKDVTESLTPAVMTSQVPCPSQPALQSSMQGPRATKQDSSHMQVESPRMFLSLPPGPIHVCLT